MAKEVHSGMRKPEPAVRFGVPQWLQDEFRAAVEELNGPDRPHTTQKQVAAGLLTSFIQAPVAERLRIIRSGRHYLDERLGNDGHSSRRS